LSNPIALQQKCVFIQALHFYEWLPRTNGDKVSLRLLLEKVY